MIKIVCMVSLMVLFLSLSATSVFAIPTHDPAHPHNAATVHWELGVAHNHRFARSFDNAPLYDANKVWDCRELRIDDDGAFDEGHGFINEYPLLGGGDAHKPRYRFHDVGGTDPDSGVAWPAAVQGAVTNAFGLWSGVNSDQVSHVIGLEFIRVIYPAAAEIEIHWHNIDNPGLTSSNNVGPVFVTMTFDSGETWEYGLIAAVGAGELHFLSVALHETGHTIGLDDLARPAPPALPPAENMVESVVAGPPQAGGPWFDALTPGSEHGARDLYMIELTHEQAAALKAVTTAAAPAVAPVNTPATITITNTGPAPIELPGWSVRRPDGRVDGEVYTPPLQVVLPGATVVVKVYTACELPGVYRYTVDWDPVSEGTFERYSPTVGGFSVLVDVISVDKPATLSAPYIGLASTILAATVATVVYVRRAKRKEEKQ
jgi:hypothetical protein